MVKKKRQDPVNCKCPSCGGALMVQDNEQAVTSMNITNYNASAVLTCACCGYINLQLNPKKSIKYT